MVKGKRYFLFCICNLEFGAWYLVFKFWYLEFGIWNLDLINGELLLRV